MPNQRQRRRARIQPESPPPPLPSFVDCFVRELTAFFRRPPRPRSRSEQHLRNAAIEMLEAMRAVLDEGIAWLREDKGASEMKRIRVED